MSAAPVQGPEAALVAAAASWLVGTLLGYAWALACHPEWLAF